MMKIEINLNPENSEQMAAFAKFIGSLAKAEDKIDSHVNTAAEMLAKSDVSARESETVKKETVKTVSKMAEQPKQPPKITLDDIRRVVAEKKEKHFQAMKATLKEEYGVSKTPDLKPEQYEAFFNYVNGL